MIINQSRNDLIKYSLLVVLLILVIGGLTWINYQFATQNPGGNDFLARWNGAHEWLINGNNPYSEHVSEVAQRMIYGQLANASKGEDVAHFVYPLYSMIFFAPFALMEYTLARALWMTLLEIVIVALTFVSLRLTNWKLTPLSLVGILLFSMLWYVSIRTIVLGQFSGINALLMVIGLLCIKNDRDNFGGVMLALSTSKPQMSYLLILFVFIWAIRSGRHRIWASFMISMGLMIGAGWLLLPGWPIDWIRQMLNYPEYTDRIGSIVSILAGITPGIKESLTTTLMAVFYLYIGFEWLRTRGNDIHAFLWTAYITVVVTNFVAYRTATPHYIALIPPLFLISKIVIERWGLMGRWFIGFLIFVLFVGLWTIFIVTLKGNDEQAVMYIPIPVITLLGLWWVRWWAIKPPTRLIEE